MVKSLRASVSLVAVISATIISTGVIANSAFADGVQDYYIQGSEGRFINTPSDAVGVGTAGSTAYTKRNSTSTTTNPAGLGMVKDGDLSLSYGSNEVSGNDLLSYDRINNDIDYGQVMLAIPLEPSLNGTPNLGTVGLGWTGSWSDANNASESEGDVEQVHGAYGLSIRDDLSLGYGLTYANIDQNTKGDAWKYDTSNNLKHLFGLQYNVADDLVLGVSYHFGQGDADTLVGGSNVSSSELTSNTVGVGLNYMLSDETSLSFAVDNTSYDVDGDLVTASGTPRASYVTGGNEGGETSTYRVGVTQAIDDMFKMRAGYRYVQRNWFYGREDLRDLNGTAKTGVYSVGLGVSIPTGMHYVPKVNVDYAAEYRDIAYGDWLQVVSLTVPFTLCAPM